MRHGVAVAGTTLLLAACQGPDYQVPGTDGLAPSAVQIQGCVRSNGQVAQIEATLYDTEAHALSGGDSLVFRAPEGASQPLEASGTAYYAQLTTPSTSLVLELVRKDGSRHASTFNLPPPFVITGPAVTSRRVPMLSTWDAEPKGPATVELSADPPTCTAGWTRTYPSDPGSVTLQGADFQNVAGTCTVSLRVTREAQATPNGELGIGNVRLLQIRTLVLETQP
ncbi:MAG TPA: hypothetical protein VF316_03205 [Polyangiaceae bacterium]